LEDQGVGRRMGSDLILGRLAGECGLDSTGSGEGPVASCCECGNEPSCSFATELVLWEKQAIVNINMFNMFAR
jgi:hypothetical protein